MSSNRDTENADQQGQQQEQEQEQQRSSSNSWYCHGCSQEVTPHMTPNRHCPNCQSDFLEQIEESIDDPRHWDVPRFVRPGGGGEGAEMGMGEMGGIGGMGRMMGVGMGTVGMGEDGPRFDRLVFSGPGIRGIGNAPLDPSRIQMMLRALHQQRQQQHTPGTAAQPDSSSSASNSQDSNEGASSAGGTGNNPFGTPRFIYSFGNSQGSEPSEGGFDFNIFRNFMQQNGSSDTGASNEGENVNNNNDTNNEPQNMEQILNRLMQGMQGVLPNIQIIRTQEQGQSDSSANDHEGENTSNNSNTNTNANDILNMIFSMFQHRGENTTGTTFQGSFGGDGAQQGHIQIILSGPDGNIMGGQGINLGDFAASPEHLQEIISRLMEQGRPQPVPAPKEVIDELPKIKLTEDLLAQDSVSDCAICKDDLQVDNEVLKLPCKHIFHTDCITPWLQHSGTCPVCRYELVEQNPNRTDAGQQDGQSSETNNDPTNQDANNSNSNTSTNTNTNTNSELPLGSGSILHLPGDYPMSDDESPTGGGQSTSAPSSNTNMSGEPSGRRLDSSGDSPRPSQRQRTNDNERTDDNDMPEIEPVD